MQNGSPVEVEAFSYLSVLLGVESMGSQVSYLGLHPEQEAVFMATCIRAVLAAEITNHAPPRPDFRA